MKYGMLAENEHVDALIHRCFEYINEEDVRKFTKKFRDQPHDSDEIMNTIRELLLGAYLCSQGFNARYECAIEGQTPDWSVFDQGPGSTPVAIVELTNFHIDKATQIDIEKQKNAKRIAVYWRDGNKDNSIRLYDSISEKALKYKNLAVERKIPLIVAIFSDIHTIVDLEELHPILFTEDQGVFITYPWVSGILFFEQTEGELYSFSYISNPKSPNLYPVVMFPREVV